MIRPINPIVSAKTALVPPVPFCVIGALPSDLSDPEDQLVNIMDYYRLFFAGCRDDDGLELRDTTTGLKSDFFDDFRIPIMVYAMYLQNFYTAAVIAGKMVERVKDISLSRVLKCGYPLPEPEYFATRDRHHSISRAFGIAVATATNIAWARAHADTWKGAFVPLHDMVYDKALPDTSDIEDVISHKGGYFQTYVYEATPDIKTKTMHDSLLSAEPAEEGGDFWDELADRYDNISAKYKRFVQYDRDKRFYMMTEPVFYSY